MTCALGLFCVKLHMASKRLCRSVFCSLLGFALVLFVLMLGMPSRRGTNVTSSHYGWLCCTYRVSSPRTKSTCLMKAFTFGALFCYRTSFALTPQARLRYPKPPAFHVDKGWSSAGTRLHWRKPFKPEWLWREVSVKVWARWTSYWMNSDRLPAGSRWSQVRQTMLQSDVLRSPNLQPLPSPKQRGSFRFPLSSFRGSRWQPTILLRESFIVSLLSSYHACATLFVDLKLSLVTWLSLARKIAPENKHGQRDWPRCFLMRAFVRRRSQFVPRALLALGFEGIQRLENYSQLKVKEKKQEIPSARTSSEMVRQLPTCRHVDFSRSVLTCCFILEDRFATKVRRPLSLALIHVNNSRCVSARCHA